MIDISDIHHANQGNLIQRNIFINPGIVWISDGDNIENNVFYNPNSDYVLVSYHCTDVLTIIVRHNSFLSSRGAIRVWGTGNMTATHNYWNTTDTSIIDSMIWDRNDDLECDNYIFYDPILTEPHPDTPIPDFNQAPTSNCGSDQVVFDEVTLDGSASFDSDGWIDLYEWRLQHRTNSSNDRDANGVNPTVYNLSPGFYDVCLTVTDDGGANGIDCSLLAAAGSCFCTASTTHIESIHAGTIKGKYGKVAVTVFDDCGNPVPGAEVTGTFSGDFNETGFGVTGANGVAVIITTGKVRRPSYSFCVDDVVKGTLPYEPNDNVETCESK